jgi:hypothetical protein
MTVYRVQPAKSSEASYPRLRPTFDENFIETKTLDPSMTFSRSSGGTFVGPDGLIKIAGVNQPRFDHDLTTGTCNGLLVEESRGNSLPYSQGFTTGWHTARAQVVTGQLDPMGGTNAILVRQTNGTSTRQYISNLSSTRITANFTVSVFVKYVNYDFVILTGADEDSGSTGDRFGYLLPKLRFQFSTETIAFQESTWPGTSTSTLGYGFQKYPNGWYRLWFTRNTAVRNNYWGIAVQSNPFVDINDLNLVTGDGSSSVLAFGFQVETGFRPTSYIITGASGVTRAADRPIINRSINTSGTLYVEAITPTTSGVIVATDNGTQGLSITLNNANDSRYALYYNTNRYLQTSSSSTLIPTEIRDITIPSNMNRISLGYSELASSGYINGTIKRFTYYAAPLTEPNIKALVGNTNNTFRDPFGIVTPGLVLNLDAGNVISYSGAGTAWRDLSGNGLNGTLINGPSYNNSNNGSVVFDGTNDLVSITYNSVFNLVTSTTINIWYFTSGSSGYILNRDKGGWEGYNIGPGSISYSGQVGGNDFDYSWGYSTNRWNMLTWVVNRQSGFYLIYLNGVQQGTSFAITHPALNSTNPLYLGSRGGVPDNFFNGRISNVLVYNRALSATEITQNFNAVRSRYGV